MSDEKFYVVVVNDSPGCFHTEDSIRLKAECGHQVWVTPRAVRSHDENEGSQYLCGVCWTLKKYWDPEFKKAEHGLVPGSLPKLREHGGDALVNEAIKFIEKLNSDKEE